ncbi:high affinity immunoglobulin gamma Fc receptor I-like [Hemibagrus wyckioides]|uniref:high affinity immunoglobulin gamma Fc receptor I-like n=1 Tax=Hemibagrus wyckioides TaxID=337641 RepID=UPI00266D3247|nr:high affinity immunoglobulin gamma Fc receptor I-like [Hemibagrus wyckioides]
MRFFHSFTVFLAWLASVSLEEPPLKAKITVSLGDPQLFTGEDVELSCSVPEDTFSRWRYQWFHNGVSLGYQNVFSIVKARVQQSGTYTCQGIKSIRTQPFRELSVLSDPLQIHVDGGWVLMQHPVKPLIVEQQMTLTCRVRDDPLLSSVIFYKDGFKGKTQNDKDLVFPSLGIEDDGIYSCRATWLKNQEYESGQSVPSTVTVLDKVETPRMVLITDPNQVRSGKDVVFNCITKVNTGPSDLRIEYHFLKDDESLGPSSSDSTLYLPRVSNADAGNYSCKVNVRDLNEERDSNQVQLLILPV